jgi:hypothetical protein
MIENSLIQRIEDELFALEKQGNKRKLPLSHNRITQHRSMLKSVTTSRRTIILDLRQIRYFVKNS